MTATATTPTTAELKDKEHATWTKMAPGWKKYDAYLTRLLAAVTERMLTGVHLAPGQRVLDIACGTGEPGLSAAAQVGPTGHVLGTDFVEEMLACAREKSAARGLSNIDFRRVDGEELDATAGAFDALLVRFGLMFMSDPQACLRGAHRALRSGGRIATACWAGPDANPWVRVPIGVLKRHLDLPPPPPNAPGIFKFADPAVLRAALETAGFSHVELTEVPVTFSGWERPEDFVTFMREIAGPISALFDRLGAEQSQGVAAEIAAEIAAGWGTGDSRVSPPGLAWVATGTR